MILQRKNLSNKNIKFLFLLAGSPIGLKSISEIMSKTSITIIISNQQDIESNDQTILSIIDKNRGIKDILVGSKLEISDKIKNILNYYKINLSYFEHGWFSSDTKAFDPLGFAQDSLLAKSRLDDVVKKVNHDKIQKDIDSYKKNQMPLSKFDMGNKYIVVILQFTHDITITRGFKDFTNWQAVVNFADKQRRPGEFLVVKMHPLNFELKESINMPHHSVAVQSDIMNSNILQDAELVVGINTTMLYEASLLYNRPVMALGDSWFDCHPEVVKKVKITDENIERPVLNSEDIDYRRAMFYIMNRMQTINEIYDDNTLKTAEDFINKHNEASKIKQIEDWVETDYLKSDNIFT